MAVSSEFVEPLKKTWKKRGIRGDYLETDVSTFRSETSTAGGKGKGPGTGVGEIYLKRGPREKRP